MTGERVVGRSGAAWRIEGPPWHLGGQALIYRAWGEDDGHPVVVKVAREPCDADVEAEGALLERLAEDPLLGPYVVPVWDRGEWHDRPFVVLARMCGTLEDARAWPLADRLVLLARLVAAVRALHAAGFVHGDLTPTNVLLDAEGVPFLADFGAACGGGHTRGYQAPERLDGGPPDAATDRWALVGTAWVLLVGARPLGEAWADGAAFDAAVPGRPRLRRALLALRRPTWWLRPRDLSGLASALGGGRPAVDGAFVGALVALGLVGVTLRAPLVCPETYERVGSVCESPAGPRLVPVPAGRFRMGSDSYDDLPYVRDAPDHAVTLSRGFWIMATEITQGEWARVLGENPVATRSTVWGDRGVGPCAEWLGDSLVGDDRPVVCVTWRDVIAYANALSARDGLPPAYSLDGSAVVWNRGSPGWRLPTEAEWERAARAGEVRPWAGARDRATVCSHANVRDASAKDRYATDVDCDDGSPVLSPVGTYHANPLGLYDMLGNAREWVWDIYGPYSAVAVDPTGPDWGMERVQRGEGWYDGAGGGVARRTVVPPDTQVATAGARLVRSFP